MLRVYKGRVSLRGRMWSCVRRGVVESSGGEGWFTVSHVADSVAQNGQSVELDESETV